MQPLVCQKKIKVSDEVSLIKIRVTSMIAECNAIALFLTVDYLEILRFVFKMDQGTYSSDTFIYVC